MKRLMLFLLTAGLMSAGYSQQVRWGVQGGLNLSGGKAVVVDEPSIKGRPAPGYALGVVADLPLDNPMWSIRPNLSYQHEACNADLYAGNAWIRVGYLNLPVDLVYHPDKGSKRWVFGLGPWFAYALGGKYTQGGYTYPVWFGSAETNNAHRLDLGLDGMVGFQLKPDMMLTAKLDWGFLDISADPQFDKIHTRSFGLNFVYWMPHPVNLSKKK